MCPGVPRDLRPSANCLPLVWISSTKPTARAPVCLFVSVFPFDKGYIRLAARPTILASVSLLVWIVNPRFLLDCCHSWTGSGCFLWLLLHAYDESVATLGNVKCKMSSEVIESHHHLSLNYLYGRPRPTQEMWHKIVEIIVKLMWNYCQN